MTERFFDQRSWFHTHRLGLFLHWGLYAINGIHEQEQWRCGVPAEEYRKLIREFNPKHFSPAQWLDFAEENGFSYLVLTAKHHDGFCLWDTRETDFCVRNTPFGRDIVGMLAEECHRRDFPLELYYSCVDWHHPAYPNLGRHHEIVTDPAGHSLPRYLEFVKRQIRELCTGYGTIHGIWWDMNVPQHNDPSINAMIRSLQPSAVINNRGYDPGDYATPERDYDPEAANPEEPGFTRPTEACQSVGMNSWGFRADEDYYTPGYFMRRIDLNLARGGNYLLNIGPDADGQLPEEPRRIVGRVGAWFNRVKQAFPPDAEAVELNDRKLLAVKSGNFIYVHCPFDLESTALSLDPLTVIPTQVTLLNTGDAVTFDNEETVYRRGQGRFLRLRRIPEADCPVFEINL